jgi:signal transduction histidine kinase/CheY-like chemotaxis protein
MSLAQSPSENGKTLPFTFDGYKPQFTADRALTAFAQLACLRLGVRRAMVSLVDSQRQYVLTEATRTLSLTRHTIDRKDDRVWIGSAVLPRKNGLCEIVFGSTYTVVDEDGTEYTGEGCVIEDASLHPTLKDRPYVVQEPHVRFYAGVPIRSRSGHTIGVYACSHNEPRPRLTVTEFKFMQDMAETVMDHLEMVRDREDRSKGERMVRGLAEFIEGSSTLGRQTEKNSSKSTMSIAKGANGEVSITQHTQSSVLERQTMNLQSVEDDQLSPAVQPEFTSRISGPKATKACQISDMSNPNCIFFRAADLIRKSTFADGAVFFRASGVSVQSKVPENLSSEDTTVDDSTSASSDNMANRLTGKHARFPQSPKFTTQKPKKLPKLSEPGEPTNKCEVLGLSISENAPGEDRLCPKEFVFSELAMERYVRKFPHGKFFSFTETGSGVSSGDDKSEPEQPQPATAINGHKKNDALPKANRLRKFIPTELLKILPSVRTLIFLPLWDSAAERWIAGGFIWTSSAGALLSPHNELPYLKAFGNSITSEYARMNALIADRAKSDFISSISHELRSPLHGVLGSVEFLNETDLSGYQNGLVGSIELCSKTLLETLEHILDYAKINKLYTKDRNGRRLEARSKRRDNESSIMGPVRDDVDLNQILEEVSESVCAGHAFRETHAAPGFAEDNAPKVYTPCNLKHVSVSLEIVPRLPYLVRTQPGAIRRIVMNLLGNALKYTTDGFIAVLVKANQSHHDSSKTEVTLTFQDSGKGITLEFQRTRLFSPFSQEDPFSDGTGLGLSIVRQIVDSLGGHIEIRSKKSVGTTVEVHLSLPNAPNSPPTYAMEDVREISKGKRIALITPQQCNKYIEPCCFALARNSAEWFGVEVLEAQGEHCAAAKPDAIVCPETLGDFQALSAVSGVPIIIVCRNQTNQVALRKILKGNLPECAKHNFQIVAQPLGPAKLGHVYKHIFSQTQSTLSEALITNDEDSIPTDSEDSAHPSRPPLNPHPPPRAVTFEEPAKVAESTEPARAVTDPQESTLANPTIAAPQVRPSQPIPIRLKSGLAEHPPRSHHILCVEDNQVNMRLLTMFMQKIKLPYSSARNGLEALEKYRTCARYSQQAVSQPPSSDAIGAEKAFTYVLMDISMPVMDGLESTKRIRAFERENGLKKAVIVALTGLASAEAQRDALDAGVDFYLVKPVKFMDLQKLMEV